MDLWTMANKGRLVLAGGRRIRMLQYQQQFQTHDTTFISQRRRFLSLPKLPSMPDMLKPLSTKHYKDRQLLKYSQQEFYDVVQNVNDYHLFLPWCTYSKMDDEPDRSDTDKDLSTLGTTIVRQGELGVGFNSLQERYVSTVTCREPSMVRAVSYDSSLFKELSTTWRFSPHVRHEMTTLIEETSATVKDIPVNEPNTASASMTAIDLSSTTSIPRPRPFIGTAAAVFGSGASLPYPTSVSAFDEPKVISVKVTASPSTTPTTKLRKEDEQEYSSSSSPSNLAKMAARDFPMCWVDFEIKFEFASPVHASMSSMFFDQVSKEMLAAFIRRCETLYGVRGGNDK